MSPAAPSERNVKQPTIAVRIGQALRRYLVAGLAALFPVAVTFWILQWLFNTADKALGRYVGFQVPGVGLVATILLVLVVGFFVVHLFGRAVFRILESWFHRLPIVRKIYPPVKQLSEFLFGGEDGQKRFRRAVLVEYPRKGSYSIGFVTNEIELPQVRSGTMLTVLIPQPPSPVTGPIIFLPKDDVWDLGISVEDAVKIIVSGGIVADPLQVKAGRP